MTAKGALSKANVREAYHIPDQCKDSYVDLGCESYSNLSYKQLRDGNEVNQIRDDARKVFDKFVELLDSPGYSQLTGKEFELSIPKEMIKELSRIANSSFNNVQGAVPSAHDQKAVTDNLFFWFLKDSICNLSEKFCKVSK
ncbi:MAG: hypothetical protein K2H03_09875 [Muribaculaceae bacterium]|nr:hypothetical protein [Muribaculaceae bacterium]